MRILFLGDVMGRSGREAVGKHLPDLIKTLKADFVIVNGENAAHGVGITDKICADLYEAGANCITTGNHIWDKKEIMAYIDGDAKLLRPLNFPPGTPGRGLYECALPDGRKIVVINAMGRLFMDVLDDPFRLTAEALRGYTLGRTVQAVFVDFHAEATSEKMSFAHYFDGRISAMVGTHTHVPTADCQIFPNGTAYQSDAGMCGDYNSVIGVKIDVPVHRFTRKTPTDKMSPADGEATLCGTFIVTDDKTGKALSIEPVRIGPRLHNTIPETAV